jgi:hypothetical protein
MQKNLIYGGTKMLRKCALLFTLVLFLSTSTLWAQNPDTLKMLPEKTLFCVQINNLNNTLSQLDQFLAGATPMPMGVSMLVKSQLMQVFGSNINMDGNIVVFGTVVSGQTSQADPTQNIFIGILAPVTDYKQFVEGNPNCGEADGKGVSKITLNGADLMLSMKANNCALLCWPNDYDKLVAMSKELSSSNSAGLVATLDDSMKKQAATEPIWAHVNVQQVSGTFGPMVQSKIQEIKTMMQAMPANQGIQPAGIQNILNMYASVIDTLLKETKSVSVAVNPKPNALNIKKTVCAVPGTDMAKMFVKNSSSQQENNLLPYLEDGAMMNFGFNISAPLVKQFQLKSIDLLDAMGGDAINSEKTAQMKTLSSNVLDCLAGPVAYTISIDTSSKPPFVVKYVLAVKDEKKLTPLIKDAINIMTKSGLFDFYRSIGLDTGFTINQGTENYKGVSIDSAKLTMKSTQPGSPQAQMIDSMYGDGFDYRWGLTKDLLLCAVGGDVDSEIHKLIDKAQSGGEKQICSETQAAIALLPGADKSDFLVTFNFLRVLKMVTAMTPMPIPQINAPTKSNIVIAGNAQDGKLVVDIALPKEHVTEIMGAVMMMQQPQTQQMQMQQN